ncbi:Crp/Fnr family transcriptional regulator [Actinomadura scrupuli]|uniref:Crp/Fnr family transcriptional regulator n=1 Tax=Actinomadura scrupuli TaxID=559629 RepID=UPI003D9A061D
MASPEPGSFLAALEPAERAELLRRGHTRTWPPAATLFSEGADSTWVLILLSGRVKASSHGENGTEVLLAVRGTGSLLGEVSAIDGLPRSATVSVLEAVEALVLTAEEFMSFLQEHPRVMQLIMRMLCERWRDADRKRIEFGMFDATSRVAQRLVELADRFGEPYRARDAGPGPGSVRITLALTQEELASWVGASREAVSKALRTLRARGWIETGRRRVIVHDLPALRRRAGV